MAQKSSQPLAQLFKQALQARRAGDGRAAQKLCQKMLMLEPQHAEVHHLLGLIWGEQGDQAKAERYLRRAIAINHAKPDYHYNLAELLRRQDKWKEAETCYRQALHLAPQLDKAYVRLAVMLKEQGRLNEAVARCQQALQLRPNDADLHYDLGSLLRDLGNYEAAIACYRRAVELRTDFADAYNDLGVALNAANQVAESLHCFRRAIDYKSDFVTFRKNLGIALERAGTLQAARDCYQDLLALAPNDELHLRTVSLCPAISNSNEEIDAYRAQLMDYLDQLVAQGGLKPELNQLHVSMSSPPFSITYQGRDDRPLKVAWANLFQNCFPEFDSRPSQGKPHIGFVVTRGHEGVFLKAMGGILNHLSGEQFRLTVVCSQQRGEQLLRPGIHNPVVSYLPLPNGFQQSLDAMHQARFDLLYYWEVGTDSVNYFLPFFRLAPVQCTGWGWPVTSGIPQMDYYLSSQSLEIADSDVHYSERLVRFQRLPSYFYRPKIPMTDGSREDFGLRADRRLYFCVQNLRKAHPDFDALVGGILRRDPQGEVLFVEDEQPALTAQLHQRLRNNLPDVIDRIRLLPRVPGDQYHRRLALADVALDTVHYVGGTTTYDAVALGVPIVTLPTDLHRGRFTYAAYRQMDLDEGIATDADDYIERALRFAHDPDYRTRFSARLREASAELFEDQAAVEELTAFFLSVTSNSVI